MSGQEDFGPLMDVLLSMVGVIDVISLVALIFPSPSVKNKSVDINNNDVTTVRGADKDQTRSIPMLVVDSMIKDGDVIDSLMSKVNELEAKVSELEINSREPSMERFLDAERYRRSQSRSPSPYGSGAAEDTNDIHTKLITRDDEFRKTIKRSSKGSSTHESREEELARLSEIEAEEMTNMNDLVPIIYTQSQDEQQSEDDFSPPHGTIDTIDEIATCPIHGDIQEIERSPEPGMSAIIDKPWCDIKKDAGKIRQQEKREQMRRSLSIEEQPVAEEIAKENDVNEKFIRMEKVALQQSSPSPTSRMMLVKQAHVNSEDFKEETINDLEVESEIVEAKVCHEEEIVKTSIAIVESFPKSEEIEIVSEEEVSFIPSQNFEAQAMSTESDLLKPPLEPTITTVLKSPENLATTKNDFTTENVTEMPAEHVPKVEIIDETSNSNLKINAFTSPPPPSSSLQQASAAMENDYAVRSSTPEPDVSISVQIDENREMSVEQELLNIVGSPSSSGDVLKRTTRYIHDLDRSASRASSRLSRRSRKSPSVTSQEDYKEWFDKFDNHISSELTLPEDEDFGSDIDEEELLMDADDGNLDGAEICKIDENRDVSVSVTLNLKSSSKKASPAHSCDEFLQQERTAYKTKADEIEEMTRLWNNRRLSIIPSTEEQQQNYVSILHPEEFPSKLHEEPKKSHQSHEHHQHMHNVGYSEWMKKIVDHHSSHLALSDSDSDSDVPLDEVQMLPLFCDDKVKTSMASTAAKKKKRRK